MITIKYEIIKDNIKKLKELVLGETNVNTIKQTIKCIEILSNAFVNMKAENMLYKKCYTDTCILQDVKKEIEDNKLIRKKQLETISKEWIEFHNNKGENNAK